MTAIVAAVICCQPVGGKLHEAVLRAGIVGTWRTHITDGTVLDPQYPSLSTYETGGRFEWVHKHRNAPTTRSGGTYAIVNNLLKLTGDPGADIPDGRRKLWLTDRNTLRLRFTNVKYDVVNVYLRVSRLDPLTSQEYSRDAFVDAVRASLAAPRR